MQTEGDKNEQIISAFKCALMAFLSFFKIKPICGVKQCIKIRLVDIITILNKTFKNTTFHCNNFCYATKKKDIAIALDLRKKKEGFER